MSIQGAITQQASLDGVTATVQSNPAGNTAIHSSPAPTVAQNATLTTRTDGTHGVLTFASPHGYAGTETLGIFWTGGSCRGCTITASTSLTVTFTVGAGTALPLATTAVTVGVAQTLSTFTPIGANIQQMIITADRHVLVEMFDSGPTSRFLLEPAGPAAPYAWPRYVGDSQPFTQQIASMNVYNADTSQNANVQVVALV